MRWSTETPAISRHPWPGSWGRGIPDRDPDTPSPFIPSPPKMLHTYKGLQNIGDHMAPGVLALETPR